MKKTIQIILAVLVILLMVAGCKSGAQQNTNAPTNNDGAQDNVQQEQTAQVTTNTNAAPKFGTLREVMMNGQSFECRFNSDGIEAVTKVKGQNFATRGSSSEGIVNSIFKDDKIYTWIEGQTDGYVMDYSKFKASAEDMPRGASSSSDYEAEMDLDCTAKSIPDSAFVPPRNVKFQDLSKMMEGLQAGGQYDIEAYQ